MIATAPTTSGATAAAAGSDAWTHLRTLPARHQSARRRRFLVRARDWLGIGVMVAFSMTLFAVTYFSLLGR